MFTCPNSFVLRTALLFWRFTPHCISPDSVKSKNNAVLKQTFMSEILHKINITKAQPNYVRDPCYRI